MSLSEEYNRVNRGRKIFVKTKSSLFENRNFCSKLFIINLLGKWTKPIWRLKFQNKFQKLKKSGSIDVFSITAQFIQEFCTKLEIYFNLGKKIKINWWNCQSPTPTHQSLHKFHKENEIPFSLSTTFLTKILKKLKVMSLTKLSRTVEWTPCQCREQLHLITDPRYQKSEPNWDLASVY